uniref:Putative ovule protein n=1 Tax=Solanum chacoense TaxID=4108 RepID=A0A0V0GKP2_SOLCH
MVDAPRNTSNHFQLLILGSWKMNRLTNNHYYTMQFSWAKCGGIIYLAISSNNFQAAQYLASEVETRTVDHMP